MKFFGRALISDTNPFLFPGSTNVKRLNVIDAYISAFHGLRPMVIASQAQTPQKYGVLTRPSLCLPNGLLTTTVNFVLE